MSSEIIAHHRLQLYLAADSGSVPVPATKPRVELTMPRCLSGRFIAARTSAFRVHCFSDQQEMQVLT